MAARGYRRETQEAVRPSVAAALAALSLALGSCGSPPEQGSPWPEAERAFRQDPRWLGGDGILSVPLEDVGGASRTLWLFGDSFVARTPRNTRGESVMVRNTVAIQYGPSLADARMTFHWRGGAVAPSSFFPERGAQWYWPGHGLRVPGAALVVWMAVIEPSPGGGGLGFRGVGARLVRVDNPDDDPDRWHLAWFEPLPPPRGAVLGAAVVRTGEHVVTLATVGDAHRGWLVRHRVSDLLAGELSRPEWWAGARGWVAQGDLSGDPETVLDDASPESSLHWDASRNRWVHIASQGFGATTIVRRTAPRLEGPWSAAVRVYTPPESREEGPFVYAAKAHHAQTARTPGRLVVTYATNSFDFWSLFRTPRDTTRYWPRVIEVEPPGE